MNSPALRPLGLLVIGSGPAGVHAATAYLEAGGQGPVCLVSADRDLPYQRPPLSKDVLAGHEPPVVTPILENDDALGEVELRLGTRIEALDTGRQSARTDRGEELAYERLVVATGSDPVPLPAVDDEAQVFHLRSLEHARRLLDVVDVSRSAVVVGSGFIGCEAAASLAGRGVQTTLVTPEPSPQAARLGTWVGDRIAAWLVDVGVELRTGVQVDSVDRSGRISLDDGGSLEADLLLVAVGVSQARNFLAEAGLETTDDGHLVVDQQLRTSDPRVWAAGDVAEATHAVVNRPIRVEHWGDATTMGQLAGRNAAGVGEPEGWSDPPGFWSQIGGKTLKYSAWGDGYDQVRVVDHGKDAFSAWYVDEAGEVVGVLTHEADEDYERGTDALSQRARLEDVLGEHETVDGS